MLIKRLAKDSLIYGGADLLTKLAAFIVFPVIAAVLSPEAFGSLELVLTVTALLGMLLNCGLNNAVQRYYWDKETTEDMRPAIVTSGYIAQIFFGVVSVAIGLVIIPIILAMSDSSEWLVSWVGLVASLFVMLFTQLTQFALDVTRLHFAPWRYLVLASTSRILALLAGLFAVVYLGLGVDGLLSAQALVLLSVMPLGVWIPGA